MKNPIGKPYERRVHSLSRFYIGIRFNEGGADSLFLIIIFMDINFEQAIRIYSTPKSTTDQLRESNFYVIKSVTKVILLTICY